MKGKILYIALLGCLNVTALLANPQDSVRVEHLSMWNDLSMDMRKNPALHGDAYRHSYSEMALDVDYLHQSKAFVQEEGTGHSLASLRVNSYLRMNNRSAVWGSASYMTGKQYGIKWNSTSDYRLLAPYVMADTLGGDTHRERYGFSGGYATKIGRTLLGGEAIIRAEHEYRDRDPRMRGIVTELTLRGGLGYDIFNYRWGVALEGSIYKQTNSVEFYNELGTIPEYHMTGLGADYSRFAGDQCSLAYRGGGFGIALDANPLDKAGIYGHMSLGRNGYERVLTSANSLPLSRLIYNKVDARMGWKHIGNRDFAVYADFLFLKRSGDENIAGKSDSQYYPVIGKLTMYKDYLLDTSLGAMYGKSQACQSWSLGIKGGYRNRRERYVYPERKMSRAHAYGSVEGQWMKSLSGSFALKVDIDASYYAHVSDDVVMPYANMSAEFSQMIQYKYRFAKANYMDFNAKVRGDYALKASAIGLFAELSGGMVLCSENERQIGGCLSLGVTF